MPLKRIVSAVARGITGMDELSVRRVGDQAEVELATVSVHPKIAEARAKLWGFLEFPPRPVDVVSVEEQFRGPLGVFKHYKVTVRTRPWFERLGRRR